MQKEISRKAKAMKRQEVARINLLVERSMAADPRLQREKQRQAASQARTKTNSTTRKGQRKRNVNDKQEEQLKQERAQKEQEEREKKAAAKAIREREKKQLRKTRQAFRKLTMNAYDQTTADNNTTVLRVWKDLEEMNDDLELLCSKLTDSATVQTDARIGETIGYAYCLVATSQASCCTNSCMEYPKKKFKQNDNEKKLVLPWRKRRLNKRQIEQPLHGPRRNYQRWQRQSRSIRQAVPIDGRPLLSLLIISVNQKHHVPRKNVLKSTIKLPNKQVLTTAASTNGDSSATTAANSDAWTEEQDQELQDGLKTVSWYHG